MDRLKLRKYGNTVALAAFASVEGTDMERLKTIDKLRQVVKGLVEAEIEHLSLPELQVRVEKTAEVLQESELPRDLAIQLQAAYTGDLVRMVMNGTPAPKPTKGAGRSKGSTNKKKKTKVEKVEAPKVEPLISSSRYLTEIMGVLMRYNEEHEEEIDPNAITGAGDLPSDFKRLLKFIPFVAVIKDYKTPAGDYVPGKDPVKGALNENAPESESEQEKIKRHVEVLIDSEADREAFKQGLSQLFPNWNKGSYNSFLAWTKSGFRNRETNKWWEMVEEYYPELKETLEEA